VRVAPSLAFIIGGFLAACSSPGGNNPFTGDSNPFTVFVDPRQYLYLSCEQIATQRTTSTNRAQELKLLMDKAIPRWVRARPRHLTIIRKARQRARPLISLDDLARSPVGRRQVAIAPADHPLNNAPAFGDVIAPELHALGVVPGAPAIPLGACVALVADAEPGERFS